MREVPKAHATNRRAKARRGPVNSLREVTLREMLQWMIRSQAPTAYLATEKVQRLDGGGYGRRHLASHRTTLWFTLGMNNLRWVVNYEVWPTMQRNKSPNAGEFIPTAPVALRDSYVVQ